MQVVELSTRLGSTRLGGAALGRGAQLTAHRCRSPRLQPSAPLGHHPFLMEKKFK